ncbi:MAG: hypothetical protein AB7F59_10120 [Bdellovibrionales bacterium]
MISLLITRRFLVFVLLAFVSQFLSFSEAFAQATFQERVDAALASLRTVPTGYKIANEINSAKSWLQIVELPMSAIGSQGKIEYGLDGKGKLLIADLKNVDQMALTIAHEFQHIKDMRPLIERLKQNMTSFTPEMLERFKKFFYINKCFEAKPLGECIKENGKEAVDWGLLHHFSNEFRAYMGELQLQKENPTKFNMSVGQEKWDEEYIKEYVQKEYLLKRYHVRLPKDWIDQVAVEAKSFYSLLDLCERYMPDIFSRATISINKPDPSSSR